MLAHAAARILQDLRLRKGLSQVELARNARVSRTVVSRLERGTVRAVQTDVLDRLFAALHCEPSLTDELPDVRKLARLEQQYRLEQNRSRHLRLAVAIANDERSAEPLVNRAKARVELWRARQTCSPYYIERWADVLSLPPRRMANAMASFDEWEDAMFQNSPWSWAWN